MAREHRQPSMLLVDLRHVRRATRQSNRQLLSEAERRVVPSIEPHRPDRQIGPLRELLRDQTRDNVSGDVCLLHRSSDREILLHVEIVQSDTLHLQVVPPDHAEAPALEQTSGGF
jgi:hypothetical protein